MLTQGARKVDFTFWKKILIHKFLYIALLNQIINSNHRNYSIYEIFNMGANFFILISVKRS